ncbi:GDSL esterase/lipase 7-like [Salvia hispanica]|uniref:GDSL esterase/lipase 7-like n=1 Tax=Salvia hispanica TaxID=49212 RepID=UPI00200966CE|nr:GDSL esterase/lipase 7-like [Salvia hispanica]
MQRRWQEGESILYGVNHASAGARILRDTSDTGYLFGRIIHFEEQINNLRKTVDKLRKQLHGNEEIQGLGLRKFLILEASPIGCIPIRSHNLKCNATLNHVVEMFNTRLKSVAHDLRSNYPGSAFTYASSIQLFNSLFDNAEAYGKGSR